MKRILIILSLIAAVVISVSAQRRITPVTPAPSAVDPQRELPDTTRLRTKSPGFIHYHNDQGQTIYVDTITGIEYTDTTQAMLPAPPKMEYPLLFNASVGVDVWDPFMRACGADYGLIGFSAGVSLHNRYRPMIEFGLGQADHTPDGGNFTYKSPTAPFLKVGADYNFFYNSDPDYELYAGVRFGLTPFKYEVTDIDPAPGYWGQAASFNVPQQKATVSYFEFLIGVRVKIWQHLSMGWQVKFHSIMSQPKAPYGDPWYIPGYGTTDISWAGAFSIYYTLPLNPKAPKKVINETGNSPLNNHLDN